ncbi:Ser/Thr protein phosphatase family protein-like protein [Tothia fuscella]|uniref:Ser/Thr protein phosphatase family protein-like protein n=1 Tax=Tothia fuscella TaxID=1048955 RepID=A0A9P4NXU2_9PEZI|nr:Ser/Thr protein phosphatase family protein-like protein [Tothia fuscella]
MSKNPNSFGANTRPQFTDMIHLQELETELIPGTEADRRLIFIGDVHGCSEELTKLLGKVKFEHGKDHVIFAGDLIAKGPDSPATVDIAMKIGASCVRGNHEDRIILAHNSLHAKVHPLPGPQEDPHVQEDFLDEESFSHGDYKDRALAKLLSEKQIKWLKSCPVILKVGPIGNYNGGGDVVVAHAGLAPGVTLDRQDPFLVMNMRTIDLQTRVPSEDRKGEPWEKIWNHHQSHLHPPNQRTTVIYGHDSKRGLNIQTYSRGLDSSCLKGGQLTALIIDSRGKQKIVSVDCKKYSG